MDSTMVYELIQQQLHSQGELLNLIPTLAHLVAPHSRFSTNRMNHQQIFAQVYGCVRNLLQNRNDDRNALLQDVQDPSDHESQEAEEQGEAEQQHENQEEMEEELEGEEEGEEEDEEEGEEEEEGADRVIDEEEEGEEEDDFLNDEEVYAGEDDVGLYGEQIDEEEMESYENEGDSQEDKEFEEEERHLTKKGKKSKQQQGEDEGDDLINDQFDHFREIELQNKEEETKNEEKNDLQKQIEKLESKIISKKDWMLQGEVKASQRPVNSLLEHDLQFKTGIRLGQEVTPEYNEEMEKMIKQRILDELYDDRVRYQPAEALREQFGSLKAVSREKSKQGLAELYESDFKNFLGLGENKHDRLRTDILDAFKELNYYLDSLSNFHFTPRPAARLKAEAAIVEERVPTASWKRNQEQPADVHSKFESEKEENKKLKRVKNKRIARQRKKEATRKKVNKKIEYGGMTKFEAKAMVKTTKNNLNATNLKYNKSANFFGQMNKDKSRKPNPNISKLKV